MTSQNDTLLEISRALGRLEAGQQSLDQRLLHGVAALDQRIVANHAEGGKAFEDLRIEMRSMKHAQHNLEQANEASAYLMRRFGEKMDPLEKLPAAVSDIDHRIGTMEAAKTRLFDLEERTGALEKLGFRVSVIAGVAASVATGTIYLVVHYGLTVVHWITGKS
jgi:hypothetical protein